MSAAGPFWALVAHLVGSVPSALIVARLRGGGEVTTAARRGSGGADAHLLIREHLGAGWSGVAAGADLAKGLGVTAAAAALGGLDERWLAVVGVVTVAGYAFPFYARELAGRGLAVSAGVYLILLPVPMVACGLLVLAGALVRRTGLASTLGFAGVPVLAWIMGRPDPLAVMGAVVFGLITARRLSGVSEVVRRGSPPWRAVCYRAVFDADAPPPEAAG